MSQNALASTGYRRPPRHQERSPPVSFLTDVVCRRCSIHDGFPCLNDFEELIQCCAGRTWAKLAFKIGGQANAFFPCLRGRVSCQKPFASRIRNMFVHVLRMQLQHMPVNSTFSPEKRSAARPMFLLQSGEINWPVQAQQGTCAALDLGRFGFWTVALVAGVAHELRSAWAVIEKRILAEH